jgi:hypothetical protein
MGIFTGRGIWDAPERAWPRICTIPGEGSPYGRAMSFRPAGCPSLRTQDGRDRSARRSSSGMRCLAVVPGATVHDAALEATMYPAICSYHASGVVIAAGLV